MYRVSAPGLGLIFAVVVFMFACLLCGFTLGFKEHGVAFVIPYLAFVAGVWLAIELAMHKYIMRKGTFVMIRKAGRDGDAPADRLMPDRARSESANDPSAGA